MHSYPMRGRFTLLGSWLAASLLVGCVAATEDEPEEEEETPKPDAGMSAQSDAGEKPGNVPGSTDDAGGFEPSTEDAGATPTPGADGGFPDADSGSPTVGEADAGNDGGSPTGRPVSDPPECDAVGGFTGRAILEAARQDDFFAVAQAPCGDFYAFRRAVEANDAVEGTLYRMSASGAVVWETGLGTTGPLAVTDTGDPLTLTPAPDGTGLVLRQFDPETGSENWSKEWPTDGESTPEDLLALATGGFVIAGTGASPWDDGVEDGFIAHLDDEGELVWVERRAFTGVTADATGIVYGVEGTEVFALDASGEERFVADVQVLPYPSEFESTEPPRLYGVAVSPDGSQVYVHGSTDGSEGFVHRLNANGDVEALYDIGYAISVRQIAVSPDGESVAALLDTVTGGGFYFLDPRTNLRDELRSVSVEGSLEAPYYYETFAAFTWLDDTRLVTVGAAATDPGYPDTYDSLSMVGEVAVELPRPSVAIDTTCSLVSECTGLEVSGFPALSADAQTVAALHEPPGGSSVGSIYLRTYSVEDGSVLDEWLVQDFVEFEAAQAEEWNTGVTEYPWTIRDRIAALQLMLEEGGYVTMASHAEVGFFSTYDEASLEVVTVECDLGSACLDPELDLVEVFRVPFDPATLTHTVGDLTCSPGGVNPVDFEGGFDRDRGVYAISVPLYTGDICDFARPLLVGRF